jgi:aromatic ring-opening dioxygenase LigB subunit
MEVIMKTSLIPIYYNTKKLEALRQYKTDVELKNELEAVLQALYEKNVSTKEQGRIESAGSR